MPSLKHYLDNKQFLADAISDVALSPIQPITKGYNIQVDNPEDVELTPEEKKFNVELARRQGGQPQYVQTHQVARTDCVPYVYSETSGTVDELKYLMEHRSFNKRFLSARKGIFERYDGDIRLVVEIKNGKVMRGKVTFSGNERREGKANVVLLKDWIAICKIAQSYGD